VTYPTTVKAVALRTFRHKKAKYEIPQPRRQLTKRAAREPIDQSKSPDENS